MKIGMVAGNIRDNKIEEQIKEIEYYLSNNPDCDLLCFGEDFLHGFHGMSWKFEIDICRAITIDSQPIKKIRELAKKFNCAVSFGYIERFNDKIYCSNMVIDRHGDILDNYRRISEGWKSNWIDTRYSEGKSFHVFELEGKQFVTAICGDLWSDHLINDIETISEGVDAVLWPLYIDYSPDSWILNARQEYADQVSSITVPILMINSYSVDENEAKGGCCVFNKGEITKELPIGVSGILMMDL